MAGSTPSLAIHPGFSHAGRAAQPLADDVRTFYLATSAAFAGYRNLQGIFIDAWLPCCGPADGSGPRPPTSMSDHGYEPSRKAHD